MDNFFRKNILFILLISFYPKAQNYQAEYTYGYKNFLANKAYDFNSVVYFNSQNQQKVYTVYYGLTDENTRIIDKNKEGIQGTRSKLKPQFIMLSDQKNNALIKDVIEQKEYILKDDISPMKWTFHKENKKVGDKILSKATTSFRGRQYTAWYDPAFKTHIAPWKFNSLPGLVYEIQDDLNQVSWQLKAIKETKEPIENPFSDDMKESAIPYTQYPELRYGLSERMKELIKNNPDNTMVEQERNGLETKFEWEK